MNRAIWGALAGWSAIVALAWWLAQRRLDECYSECNRHSATAARDAVLIWGPAVPMGVLALVGLIRLFGAPRLNRSGSSPASTTAEARRSLP